MAKHEEPIQKAAQSKDALKVGEVGGIVDFSIANALRVSKTMEQMQPVGEAEARAWVNYWSSVGLF
jgi:hypothetical protein